MAWRSGLAIWEEGRKSLGIGAMQDSTVLQSLLRTRTKAPPYWQLKTSRWDEEGTSNGKMRGWEVGLGVCWQSKWRFLSICLVTIFVHIHYVSFHFIYFFFGCSSENTFLDLSVLKFWSELVVGRSREIMEMPELRWHFHKPYEFLRKKQCPQLDLKWGFLCGCSYSRYTVGGYYFIFCKRCQCKTTLI